MCASQAEPHAAMALFQSACSGTNKNDPGIRKASPDWLILALVFSVGLMSGGDVADSQTSEWLQIPERSRLQSGRKVGSPSVGLDVHSSVGCDRCPGGG